jgi:hypothetical protein
VPEYFLAIACIGLERLDDAVRWLERGHGNRDGFLVELKVNPWMDPVRADPRVQEIIRAMQFPD